MGQSTAARPMVARDEVATNLTVQDILQRQRQFFNTGQTKSPEFRIEQLHRLKQAILDNQARFVESLRADLRKPEFEAYATEISVVQEIDYAIKHLRRWMKPRSVPTPPTLFPSSARIYPEPLGVVLIIGAWNYPLYLMVAPLVAAIAAGNCAVLKPSEISPHTARVFTEMLQDTFEPGFIAAVEGGVETSQALLAEKFDHILFTGGTAIGRIVMEAAAKHLTPVTLELGGKSPCIVDADVDLDCAARRIVWGKFVNTGQTCVAPDYVLADRRVKPALLSVIQRYIHEFYGDDPASSPDFGRIVSSRHFERIRQLIDPAKVVCGGKTKAEDCYIAPTVMDGVSADDPVMQEEIFGPILPVLEYETLRDAIAFIKDRPKPLSLYIFSKNKATQDRILTETSSGGACVNETIMHLGVPELPLGGVGNSGMGCYSGKHGFDTFSHHKSVLKRPFWLDLKFRYAPYAKALELVKKLMT